MLSVLAPRGFYSDYELKNLGTALNAGLVEFGEKKGVPLGFEFCQLGSDYATDSTAECIRSAIEDRCRIWVAASK